MGGVLNGGRRGWKGSWTELMTRPEILPMHALTIRVATRRDETELLRLAQLKGRSRPTGRTLLAERDGIAIAAVALSSGAVVADPCDPAGDTGVRLLRRRRYQLLRQGGDVGPVASLLRRLVPPTPAAA
jgi:hypothetical protein